MAASGHRDPRLEFSRKGAIKNENTKIRKKFTKFRVRVEIDETTNLFKVKVTRSKVKVKFRIC